MYLKKTYKLFFILFVFVSFLSLTFASVPVVQAATPKPTPTSLTTSIYILPDTTYPQVGYTGHIRIYVYYSDWPWSSGYVIQVRFDSSYAKLVGYYDTPDIYYNAHYIPPRLEVTWFFAPLGGVSGSGSETRTYIDIEYIKAGTFTIYAEVYQSYNYGSWVLLIPRASTYVHINVQSV